MANARPFLAVALVALALTASPVAAQVERTRHGDTTVVRTTGPGLWGGPKVAVEEKRLAGPAPDLTFMLVGSIGLTPTGLAIVADTRNRDDATVYYLDANGGLVRKLYLMDTVRLGLRVMAAPDSSIFVAQNNFLERFNLDGKLLGRTPLPRNAPGGLTQPGKSGSFYRPEASFYEFTPGAPGPPQRMAELLIDSVGNIVKTLPAPTTPYTKWPRDRYDPRDMYVLLPDGTYAVGVSDTLAFTVPSGKPEGGYVRAILPGEAPTYTTEEREEWTKVFEYQRGLRQFPGALPPPDSLPTRKQMLLSILTDNDGRIWLKHTTSAVKGPPRIMASSSSRDGGSSSVAITYDDLPAYDAFRRDGTFLGDVSFPPGARIMAMSGDVVWAVMPGDKPKEQFIIKYRIPGIASKQ